LLAGRVNAALPGQRWLDSGLSLCGVEWKWDPKLVRHWTGCPGQWGSPHPWRGSKNCVDVALGDMV